MGSWRIAGRGDGAKPRIGEVYEIRHQRKGRFSGRASDLNGEWLTVEVVDGIAEAMMAYNVRGPGETVTIRDVHTYLTPLARAGDGKGTTR